MRGLIQGEGVGSRAPVRSVPRSPWTTRRRRCRCDPQKDLDRPAGTSWAMKPQAAREDSSDFAGRFLLMPLVSPIVMARDCGPPSLVLHTLSSLDDDLF